LQYGSLYVWVRDSNRDLGEMTPPLKVANHMEHIFLKMLHNRL